MAEEQEVYMEQTLHVKLTDDELRQYGDELAKIVDEQESVEDAKKEAASNFKATLDSLQNRMNGIAAKIRNKQELRLVRCVEQHDDETKRVNTVRTDTQEIVSWRAMTQEEMQRKLFKAV